MNRLNANLIAAVIASLAAHAAFLGISRRLDVPRSPVVAQAREESVTVSLQLPPDPLPPRAERHPDDMGETTGKGIGANAAAGEKPLEAREADNDQAFLSRSPSGSGSAVDPSSQGALAGAGGSGGHPGAAAMAIAMSPAAVTPADPAPLAVQRQPPQPPPLPAQHLQEALAQLPPAAVPSPLLAAEQPTADPSLPTVRPAPPVPSPQPPAPAITLAAPAVAATGDGRAPGARAAAGDPGQRSDSDSDAFSTIGTAIFRDGRLETRFGRKVKTTRIHLDLSGEYDLLAVRRPVVELAVAIDETGNVIDVRILRSSGSNDLDQPTRREIYNWTFEPTRRHGKAVPDILIFPIGFVE